MTEIDLNLLSSAPDKPNTLTVRYLGRGGYCFLKLEMGKPCTVKEAKVKILDFARLMWPELEDVDDIELGCADRKYTIDDELLPMDAELQENFPSLYFGFTDKYYNFGF